MTTTETTDPILTDIQNAITEYSAFPEGMPHRKLTFRQDDDGTIIVSRRRLTINTEGADPECDEIRLVPSPVVAVDEPPVATSVSSSLNPATARHHATETSPAVPWAPAVPTPADPATNGTDAA